jgi:hypothetical protein
VARFRLDHAREHVVVVTHQAVSPVSLHPRSPHRGRAVAIDRDADIANTAVTTFVGDGTLPPTLLRYNDDTHLPPALATTRPDVPAASR